MSYYQLFYHIIWATRYRQPVLTPDVEQIMYGLIQEKARQLGARVLALNGWLDHVHLLASVPPKLSLARFVGQIKGASSAGFNKTSHPAAPVYWQEAYAVFSVDGNHMVKLIDYIQVQKQHHAAETLDWQLEYPRSYSRGLKPPAREPPSTR